MTADAPPVVLLVDDRPENLTALAAVLEPLVADGLARVVTAASGEIALRQVLVLDDALAVVLLDVMMPVTDGLETARLIRKRARSEHVPIIFLTALDADRRRVNLGYQSGAVDYLTKPVEAEVIRGKVRAFVELHRRRGEAVLAERRRYADAAAEAERVAKGRLDAALEVEAQLVATVQRIGSVLAAELDLGRLIQTVTEEATALIGAEFGAFYYNPSGDPSAEYTLAALTGIDQARVDAFSHRSATQLFGPTFRGDGVVRSADVAADARDLRMPAADGLPAGRTPVRSYLAVSVTARTGEAVGRLVFGHAEVGVFGPREERLAGGVAGWAAVALDNARLYQAERDARAEAERQRAEAEQQRAEAEQQRAEAVAANRAKAEFLAVMSHELRTPLNAIGGYAELLELGVHGPVTDAQRDAISRIQRSQQHLTGLVSAVLNYARIEAGALAYADEDVPLDEAVETVVALVAPLAAAKALTLDVEASADRATARADGEKVRQVLLNLLANAMKFTPRGGSIDVRVDGSTAGVARVHVRDSGAGIPSGKRDAVFEPFVQVESGLTRTHDGVGLGLAISRDLARGMGGDLVVESVVGEGSTFTLTLPHAADTIERPMRNG